MSGCERRDPGDPVADARPLVRDRDAQRGERLRALADHVRGGVEPPLAARRCSPQPCAALRSPSRPARSGARRGTRRGSRSPRRGRRSSRGGRAGRPCLTYDSGTTWKAVRRLPSSAARRGQPDVVDRDRHRDRGRLPVGRDRHGRPVAAGLRVRWDGDLEVERLVRLLGRPGRAVPGEEGIRHGRVRRRRRSGRSRRPPSAGRGRCRRPSPRPRSRRWRRSRRPRARRSRAFRAITGAPPCGSRPDAGIVCDDGYAKTPASAPRLASASASTANAIRMRFLNCKTALVRDVGLLAVLSSDRPRRDRLCNGADRGSGGAGSLAQRVPPGQRLPERLEVPVGPAGR